MTDLLQLVADLSPAQAEHVIDWSDLGDLPRELYPMAWIEGDDPSCDVDVYRVEECDLVYLVHVLDDMNKKEGRALLDEALDKAESVVVVVNTGGDWDWDDFAGARTIIEDPSQGILAVRF